MLSMYARISITGMTLNESYIAKNVDVTSREKNPEAHAGLRMTLMSIANVINLLISSGSQDHWSRFPLL